MTPDQERKLDRVVLLCERLDERTDRMGDEMNRRFEGVHGRIKEVREDAKAEARKVGGGFGGLLGTGAAIVVSVVRDMLSGPS